MATSIEDFIAQLREDEKPITLKLMGFQNDVRQEITSSAMQHAREGVSVYQKRRDLIAAAIAANVALQEHGHPVLPRIRLPRADYDTLTLQPTAMLSSNEQLDIEEPPATDFEAKVSAPEPR